MPDTQSMQVLVVSPWGESGGYSGPVTLQNRLFSALAALESPQVSADLVYRRRSVDRRSTWARNRHALLDAESFGRLAQLRWAFGAALYVRRHRRKYDLVHIHGVYLANVLPGLAAGRRRAVLLPVMESGDLALPRNTMLRGAKRVVLRRLIRRARTCLALTPRIAHEFAQLGARPQQVKRFPNPAGPADPLAGERTRPSSGPVRVGFVGKIGPIKRPHLVLAAVANLVDRGYPAAAVLVGPVDEGTYGAELREAASREPLRNRVTFTGLVDDVTGALRNQMDVFVLPSSAEGMPGALAEAMMAGLPCIVTDVGGMSAAVRDGSCGLVVEADAESIADAVLHVCEPVAWETYSRRAARFGAKSYSTGAAVQTYLDATALGRRASPER